MPVPSRREALARPAAKAPASGTGPALVPPPTAPVPPAVPAQPAAPLQARAPRSASATNRPPRPKRAGAGWPKADVAVALALGAVSVGAAVSMEAGLARTLLALPMLLFVPGYLLLQAFVVPAATGPGRGWQVLASLGISPAVVGLLSLMTSIVDGGFRLGAILALTAFGTLAFGVAALVRRNALANASPTAKPADSARPAAAHAAATAKSGPTRP